MSNKNCIIVAVLCSAFFFIAIGAFARDAVAQMQQPSSEEQVFQQATAQALVAQRDSANNGLAQAQGQIAVLQKQLAEAKASCPKPAEKK